MIGVVCLEPDRATWFGRKENRLEISSPSYCSSKLSSVCDSVPSLGDANSD